MNKTLTAYDACNKSRFTTVIEEYDRLIRKAIYHKRTKIISERYIGDIISSNQTALIESVDEDEDTINRVFVYYAKLGYKVEKDVRGIISIDWSKEAIGDYTNFDLIKIRNLNDDSLPVGNIGNDGNIGTI